MDQPRVEAEVGRRQALDRLVEVDHPELGAADEQAEETDDPVAAPHRGPTRLHLVEEHQLRGDEISQQDRVALARVKSNDRHLHRVDLEEHRLEPVRALGDRLSYDGGGRGMAQLRLDRRRNEDPAEETGGANRSGRSG
jgi:hypothetical protein